MTAEMHPAALPIEELLQQCRIWRQRRSGPGGQHRNKVETAVFIEHLPTGIRGEASERRSQEQNRRAALTRLRTQLAIQIRRPVGRIEDYSPSSMWMSRLVARRPMVRSAHDDFPIMLAEALDVFSSADFRLPQAAAALGTTSSQLVKLLAQEPAALSAVNAERRTRRLRPCTT